MYESKYGCIEGFTVYGPAAVFQNESVLLPLRIESRDNYFHVAVVFYGLGGGFKRFVRSQVWL